MNSCKNTLSAVCWECFSFSFTLGFHVFLFPADQKVRGGEASMSESGKFVVVKRALSVGPLR